MREVAVAWPLGSFIEEELEARGWTTRDLALRMGSTTPEEIAKVQLCIELTIAVADLNLLLDDRTVHGLSRAFDVSPEFFRNLDTAWRKWAWRQKAERQEQGK